MQVATTYDQGLARKHPEQVALAIVKDPQGKPNPITLGWIMNTSWEPPLFAISIGKTRYSLAAIRGAREFVICYPSADMAADALFFGTMSGRDLDKLAERGTRTQPATRVDSVLLADAVANFECTLEAELETGDHVLFVGRVVATHVNQDVGVRRLYTLGGEQLGGVVPG